MIPPNRHESSPLFRGIIPSVVTPLLAQDTLDVQGFDRLIDHLIAGGVHGLVLLGACGEGPSLSYRLRREVILCASNRVRGRVPLLVEITDCSFSESVALAEIAHEAQAAAVLLSPPYFYAPAQSELVSYVRHLHDELPLPLVLSNASNSSNSFLDLHSIEQLIDLPKLIGLNDCTADAEFMDRVHSVARRNPKLSLLTAKEAVLGESMARGASGAVCGGANLFPHLFVRWYEALCHGDEVQASTCQSIVEQLQSIHRVGHSHSATVKALKAALAYFHICGELAAEPFQPFEEAENAAIASILEGVEQQLHHSTSAISCVARTS